MNIYTNVWLISKDDILYQWRKNILGGGDGGQEEVKVTVRTEFTGQSWFLTVRPRFLVDPFGTPFCPGFQIGVSVALLGSFGVHFANIFIL